MMMLSTELRVQLEQCPHGYFLGCTQCHPANVITLMTTGDYDWDRREPAALPVTVPEPSILLTQPTTGRGIRLIGGLPDKESVA